MSDIIRFSIPRVTELAALNAGDFAEKASLLVSVQLGRWRRIRWWLLYYKLRVVLNI